MRLANAYGTDLLFDQYEGYTGAENGLDLVTTIDLTIQHYVEKSLYQAVEDYDIQNGAGAIAMDVKTGKILAMASIGGYDLNNFLDVSDEAKNAINEAPTQEEKDQILADAQRLQWRNKTLSDTYEPGSTFKIITLSMALEEGKVSLDDSFFCGALHRPCSIRATRRSSISECASARRLFINTAMPSAFLSLPATARSSSPPRPVLISAARAAVYGGARIPSTAKRTNHSSRLPRSARPLP